MALAAPFDFIFLAWPFLVIGLHPECFWLGFIFVFQKFIKWVVVHYIIESSIRVYINLFLQNLLHISCPYLLQIAQNLMEM